MAERNSKRRIKNLTQEEKRMICNVYEGLRRRDSSLSMTDALTLCSILTKVSESSIRRCVINGNKLAETSTAKENTRGRKKIIVDDDTRYAIRRKIHSFFFRNEIPNLKKIGEAIKADETIPSLSRGVLLRTMREMNFRFLKRNRKSALIEKSEIVLWRRRYLRKISELRRLGKKIFFMDETWVNEGHTVQKVWQDLSVTNSRQAVLEGLSPGLKSPSGKGRRLIITHIGSETGFLDNGLLLFESKKTVDYHEEMNADTFEKWFASILPRMEPGSVIVMDNASYHSRQLEPQPTSAWRKGKIIDWLQNKGIAYNDELLKVELLNIARLHKTQFIKYAVDEIAKPYNVEILRLPPYHCELNPIELIWAQVKGEVARKNRTFKMADLKVLFYEAIQNVTAKHWENCINHTKKIEQKMWDLDVRVDAIVEPLVIQLNSSSSDSDSSELCSSDIE